MKIPTKQEAIDAIATAHMDRVYAILSKDTYVPVKLLRELVNIITVTDDKVIILCLRQVNNELLKFDYPCMGKEVLHEVADLYQYFHAFLKVKLVINGCDINLTYAFQPKR